MMNKRIWWTTAFGLILGINLVYAQGDPTAVYQDRYERGKELYQQGKYDLAIDLFKTLSRTEQNNPYVTYASFYFALSAFRSGDYALAKNMLQQIKTKYPKWNKMSEVDYWLANTHFELGDHQAALRLLAQLDQQPGTTQATLEDAARMKEYYIAQVVELEQLQNWLAQYPQDKVLATQLAERIVLSGASNDEQIALKDSLVQAFNIDEAAFGVATKAASIKKDVYNVATFLPFFRNKLTMENERIGNAFVLEMYQGMRMATDQLQDDGINVQLYAYDTERDYDVTQRLLEKEELAAMDAIVGPLYPGPIRAVSEFSREQQVYMINPVSSNPLAISTNPFSYLMKPSTLTEAQMAARYATDTLEQKMAIVVTDGSPRDSARVNRFIETFKKDDSYEVFIEELTSSSVESIEAFADTLVHFSVEREQDLPVVYLASDSDLLITNTISAVVMAKVPLVVFGNDRWFDITSVTYEQLEELDVRFLSPAYIDYQRRTVQKFAEAYKQRFNALPSKYAYAGYDAMYYIGQMLNEYGIYFQEFYTDRKPVSSLFYEGYNFFEANDNQVIPIIHFEDGVLREVDVESDIGGGQ